MKWIPKHIQKYAKTFFLSFVSVRSFIVFMIKYFYF